MGTIELKLTQLKRFLFFAWHKKITVGFSFINMTMLICARNLNIELKDFFDWAEKNETLYFSEMLYAAYLAYHQERYIKPVLSKKELIIAFSETSDEDKKKLMRVWQESESFAVKKDKKKAKK